MILLGVHIHVCTCECLFSNLERPMLATKLNRQPTVMNLTLRSRKSESHLIPTYHQYTGGMWLLFKRHSDGGWLMCIRHNASTRLTLVISRNWWHASTKNSPHACKTRFHAHRDSAGISTARTARSINIWAVTLFISESFFDSTTKKPKYMHKQTVCWWVMEKSIFQCYDQGEGQCWLSVWFHERWFSIAGETAFLKMADLFE